MKKIVLVLVMLVMAVPVLADDNKFAMCGVYKVLAHQIMEARQDNVDMFRVMEIMKNIKEKDEKMEEISRVAVDLVIKAYERPLFSTDANKKKEVQTFSNDVFLNCIKGNM